MSKKYRRGTGSCHFSIDHDRALFGVKPLKRATFMTFFFASMAII